MRGPNTLGKFLRLKRQELGLTMAQLGKQSGLSASTISHVETGQFSSPTMHVLKLISEYYKINLIELMKMIDKPDRRTQEYINEHG